MLMTDDTGWNDFGCYSGGGAALGHPTPNIDRIAKEGAMFPNWYGQANCTAGRASFITGRIPIRSALSIVCRTRTPRQTGPVQGACSESQCSLCCGLTVVSVMLICASVICDILMNAFTP